MCRREWTHETVIAEIETLVVERRAREIVTFGIYVALWYVPLLRNGFLIVLSAILDKDSENTISLKTVFLAAFRSIFVHRIVRIQLNLNIMKLTGARNDWLYGGARYKKIS